MLVLFRPTVACQNSLLNVWYWPCPHARKKAGWSNSACSLRIFPVGEALRTKPTLFRPGPWLRMKGSWLRRLWASQRQLFSFLDCSQNCCEFLHGSNNKRRLGDSRKQPSRCIACLKLRQYQRHFPAEPHLKKGHRK